MDALDSTAVVAPDFAKALRFRPWFKIVLGVVATVSLLLQYGFSFGQRHGMLLNWLDVFLACGFAGALLVELLPGKRRHGIFRHRRFEALLLGTFVATIVLILLLPNHWIAPALPFFHLTSERYLLFGLVKLYLLGSIGLQMLRAIQRIFVSGIRLEVVLAGSFGALIVLGTLLLLLPRASAKPDAPISLIDAFFTATSAACVTGLGVRDTGSDFSTIGQIIILALIQIGGLGIVTFVAFISAFSAKTLPVPQMVAFRQVINAPAVGDLKRRLAGILLLTVLIEGAGAASLYALLSSERDPFERLSWAVFHSISAFCNAGFALQPDGLESVQTDVGINWTVMLLITAGSLGFLVLPELIDRMAAALRRIPLLCRRRSRQFLPPLGRRFTIQTRMSLLVTILLVVIGVLGFWALEADNILADSDAGESLLISSFQSVTTRTAGFNTVAFGELRQSTLIFVIILMVIGGCPVSTAGGIKTVTFGVLILALRSMIYRREKVEAFGRTLPARAFFTALNVFVLYTFTAGVGVFLVSVFDPHLALRDSLFETISALSTVGLSTGITASLSVGSKLVLCAAMFIGRVGPISLVFSVFQARGKVEYQYPTEDVVVG